MKPIILITGGIPVKSDANQIWSLNRDYADAISRAGGVPLLALDENSAGAYAQIADGLLLSGGRDVSPTLYNRETKTNLVITEPKRDSLEWKILDVFAAKQKPIFGICRGIQMMNVYFGGTLYQDIPSELGGNHSNGVNHMLTIKKESVLGGIFGKTMHINSYHHQVIDDLAPGFVATAWSNAGGQTIVEGIEHESLPFWGVQWHPERMTGEVTNPVDCVDSLPMFRYFVNQCRRM